MCTITAGMPYRLTFSRGVKPVAVNTSGVGVGSKRGVEVAGPCFRIVFPYEQLLIMSTPKIRMINKKNLDGAFLIPALIPHLKLAREDFPPPASF